MTPSLMQSKMISAPLDRENDSASAMMPTTLVRIKIFAYVQSTFSFTRIYVRKCCEYNYTHDFVWPLLV
jgi:hypothetical protein